MKMGFLRFSLVAFLVAVSSCSSPSRIGCSEHNPPHPLRVLEQTTLTDTSPQAVKSLDDPPMDELAPYLPFLGTGEFELRSLISEVKKGVTYGSLSRDHFEFYGDGGLAPFRVEKKNSTGSKNLVLILRIEPVAYPNNINAKTQFYYEFARKAGLWYRERFWTKPS